jgi:glycosyltransferase involved in cell wall biosynthesis/GT2 family glycosyltransferase
VTAGDRRPVTVVVVAYGAPDLLDAALQSLGGAYPVTVVDNSSDPEVRAVVDRFGAEYVDPGRNLGFAGGVNLGTSGRIAPGTDVLLLNPDAAIAPEGVALLQGRLLSDDRLAAVAPPQHDPATGVPARVGWPFPTPFGAWVEAVGLGGLRRRTDYLIGSVLLLRGEALADVGPFDNRFFLYAEEADWQRRAADRGWMVALCPGVTATHVGSGTGGAEARREAHFHASHERYLRKHHGTGGWWNYRSAALVGAAVRAVVLRGERGRQAAARFTLYRRGPLRVEAADDRVVTGTLSVVHVVLTGAFAGVERYVCQVANGLAGRGHRVEVIGGDPPRMRDELVPSVDHRPATSVRRGAALLAGRRDADLVHAHMTAAEVAAWLARPVDRLPTVATRHFASGRGSTPAARVLAGVASRSITRDIAISEFVAQTISTPSVLIPNGVAERPQAALDAPTVVMLQRLDREKAPEVGIRAWACSALPASGWTLVVAGSGVLRPDLETLVRTLGCAGSVTFAGQVADTDGLLAQSSILLAPAPEEPFGLSVVEAMARGVPVVAAGGGAHLETVGGAGILFPTGDVRAAARALEELAADPALRRQVGAALRVRQQERFSLDRHLDRLEELYRSVAAEPRRAAAPAPTADRARS